MALKHSSSSMQKSVPEHTLNVGIKNAIEQTN
jgi:hypothetical protein